MAAIGYDGIIKWQTSTNASPASAALTSVGFASITPSGVTMVGFNGTLLWRHLGTGFPGAAPSASNGSIYLVTDEANSRLIALSNFGEVYWQQVLSHSQYALSAPTICDGVLYISSDNGHVYAFNMNNVAPPATVDFSVVTNNLIARANFSTEAIVGSLFEYTWDYGDGSHASGSGSLSHTYAVGGT